MRKACFASVILMALIFTSPTRGESYVLPGETSKPASEGLVTGTPGLVGIFYGHLPCNDCQRQKTLLILFVDPKTNSPKSYTLERILVGKGNERHVTKGTWSLVKDKSRPGATIYELDNQAPVHMKRFWAVEKSTLLVLDQANRTLRSTFKEPYTATYSLYARDCKAGQTLKDCSDE